MSFHQRTKDQRRHLAGRSEKILNQAPNIPMEGLAHRLGLKNYQHLHQMRVEFNCRSLSEIPGREPTQGGNGGHTRNSNDENI